MWSGAGGGLEESDVIGLPTVSAQGKRANFLILYICDGCNDEKMFIYFSVY